MLPYHSASDHVYKVASGQKHRCILPVWGQANGHILFVRPLHTFTYTHIYVSLCIPMGTCVLKAECEKSFTDRKAYEEVPDLLWRYKGNRCMLCKNTGSMGTDQESSSFWKCRLQSAGKNVLELTAEYGNCPWGAQWSWNKTIKVYVKSQKSPEMKEPLHSRLRENKMEKG